MIALILGTDSARASVRSLFLSGKAPRELLFGDDAEVGALLSLAQSVSLFGENRVFGIVGRAEDEVWTEALFNALKELAQAPHLFLFEEENGASFAKAVEKAGGQVLKAKEEKQKESFDTFALANALGVRDKKKLWLLYITALRQGASAEMLAGMLAWKARSQAGKDRISAELSSKIVSLYHESRRGAGPLDLLLERFILSL